MRVFPNGEGFGRGYGYMFTDGRRHINPGIGYGDGAITGYGDGSGLGDGYDFNNLSSLNITGSGRSYQKNKSYPYHLIQYWN